MSLKYETDRKGHDGRLSLIVHQTKLKPVYKRVQFRVQRQRSDSWTVWLSYSSDVPLKGKVCFFVAKQQAVRVAAAWLLENMVTKASVTYESLNIILLEP